MPFTLCTCGQLLPLGVRHDHRTNHGRPRSYRERKRYTEIAKAKGGRCHYCPARATTADHLDGNSLNNHPSNIVPCCRPCNTAKGTRTAREFLAMRHETPPSQPPSPTPPAPQPPPPSTP